MDAPVTPDDRLAVTEADAIALEYLDACHEKGIVPCLIERSAICSFASWIMRNYDVYRLDEVNRG
jgi:hypothetical protein